MEMKKGYRGFIYMLTGITVIFYVLSIVWPWWIATVYAVTMNKTMHIWIYAYGLEHDAVLLSEYLLSYKTPSNLMLAAKILLPLIPISYILSFFVKGKWGWRIMLTLGIIYLVYSLGFIPVIYEGTGRAPTPGERFPVQGKAYVHTDIEELEISASFQTGYFLALASSCLFIIGAFLKRPKKLDNDV